MAGRLFSTFTLTRQTTKKASNFHIKNLKFIPREKRQEIPKEMAEFGSVFTDHMLVVDYKGGEWSEPVIRPLDNLSIHPAAKVLHYSPTIFEGLKAFRGVDKEIRLFRIERNMARMIESARRAALPEFCPLQLEHMIERLVRHEQDWVPSGEGTALYIRPFMFGSQPCLGVKAPTEAQLVVICSPVGPYYASGWKPVSLYADPAYIRAAPGGVGAYKMGCNYAPTLTVQEEAARMGCQQALWLWGEQQLLTEAGTTNIFLLWKNTVGELELVTPPTTGGLILPGVTRESILILAREWGEFKVSERNVTMKAVIEASREGRLLEFFGAGTAAVVSPVQRILYVEKDHHEPVIVDIPPHSNDSVSARLLKTISDIQHGRVDRPEWVRIVDG